MRFARILNKEKTHAPPPLNIQIAPKASFPQKTLWRGFSKTMTFLQNDISRTDTSQFRNGLDMRPAKHRKRITDIENELLITRLTISHHGAIVRRLRRFRDRFREHCAQYTFHSYAPWMYVRPSTSGSTNAFVAKLRRVCRLTIREPDPFVFVA